LDVLTIVVPVFALIAIGYAALRTGLVGAATNKGLSDFAFSLAMPALLFRTIAGATQAGTPPLPIIATFFLALAIVWGLATLLTRIVLARPAADAPAIAMSSTYGNVAMLGIPVTFAVLGEAAAGPIAVIMTLHTPFLWLLATLQQQWSDRAQSPTVGELLRSLALDLLRNPLIIAIIAGGLWRLTGLGLPPLIDRVLMLLSQAGVPCALVALGMTLTGFRIGGQLPTLTTVLILKLLATPLIAFALARHVFNLPPVALGVVVLFAAMPSGANAYLFATRYQRAVNSASGAVALGSALSAITVSLIIFVLRG
jgi:malonate transporter and related proteins